jgi:hypothetical protein
MVTTSEVREDDEKMKEIGKNRKKTKTNRDCKDAFGHA